uniref:C-type lectin domain-containing protein n=1 Tax=Fundulus heteroclitus TaxID=8078 RepID=A0A3Q2P5C2_FUNHE
MCCFIDCQLYEYHYIKKKKNWTEAQQYCREKHTDLATVSNMTDMKRLLNNSAGDKMDAWIGLFSKPEFNRTWYWSLPGEEFNETQKYQLINEQKTWQKAQSYCRENHTDLVSGLKQLQDKRLKEVVESVRGENPNEPHIHFGLFRDSWRWSDGSSFSFRNWPEDFNNQEPNSGLCARVKFNEKGRWKNNKCGDETPFICYDDKVILIKESKTWEEALYYCRDHHHDLVTITNLDEQRWVQEKAKNASTGYVWTGLRYTCTLDFWFWVSDEVVSYENWAPDGLMDDCDMSGAMETGGEHLWRKRNDLMTFNFICSNN